MKQWNFKMKKLCSAKHLKPWLMNSTDQQSVHKWETSQKKAICIIVYYIIQTLAKSKCVVSYMIKLHS